MSEARALRVGELIQREIASILSSGGLKDDRIGFVTITGADVTSDLREATVFFVTHGTDAERKASAEALASHAGRLRSHIGRVMKLHHAPALHFREDRSVDEGDKIDRLLREVREKEGW